jgi:uncharacterized protein
MKQKQVLICYLSVVFIFFLSCSKNKDTQPDPADKNSAGRALLTGDYSKSCKFIDGSWSNESYADNVLIDASNTDFINSHHAALAYLWGENVSNVPLYFAHGGNTRNAYSYSYPKKIIYGEDMYRDALQKQGYVAAIYVLGHEWGHQLQFTYNLPSVKGYANAELEADGFGGYYLNKPNSAYGGNWPAAATAVEYASTLGGGNHGTNAQRRSATRLGWWLGNYDLTPQWFDYYFFQWFQQVLDGTYKKEINPTIRPDADPRIVAKLNEKMDELKRIANNEISDEEFINLSSE